MICTWNVGILHVNDRPHTEAEITLLSKAWREYATSDIYETKWTDDVPGNLAPVVSAS